ncbi:MAG: hypothetical protein M3O46_17580 [Myxococcota bacterium]|nr:hypothetical protein [Myxococcota bacterium]
MPRHVVTRALEMEESVRVSARWRIEEILSEPRPPEDHVRALIDAALQASAQDNIAVVVTACRATAVAPSRRPSGRPAESTLGGA